jgi:hypothetical protein
MLLAAGNRPDLREAEAEGRAEPEERAQRNCTDPQSRIMRGGDAACRQGCNAQAALDGKHQIIVAAMLLTTMAAAAPLC